MFILKIYINDWDITYEKAKKLLTHTEYEYSSKEESLNSAYRAKVEQEREQERKRLEAQREAERKAAERKRLEEERARQREEEEKRNLPYSLPVCVESWQSHSNSSLKHKYFYDYFSYASHKNYATPSMWDTWHTVWDFKNDIDKNVSISDNAVARNKVVQLVESTIRSTFGTKTKYLTLVCLTASTQNKNENSGDKMPNADTFKIFYASGCLETLDDGVINQEKKTMLQTAIESNGYHIFPEDMRTDLNGVTTLSGYDLYIFEDLGLVDVTLDGGAVWYINSWAQGTMLGENVGEGSYNFEVSNSDAKDIASITIKQGVLFNELTTSDGKIKATVEIYRAISQDLQKYTAVYSSGEAPLILAAEDGGRAVIVVTFAFENSNLNMYRANFKKLVANFIDFSGN